MFLTAGKNGKKKLSKETTVRVRVLRDENRRPYFITIFHHKYTLSYRRHPESLFRRVRIMSRGGKPITEADVSAKLMNEFTALVRRYFLP